MMKEARPSFWALTADKLQSHPELLAVARANCTRWLTDGHNGLEKFAAMGCAARSSGGG